MSSARKAAPPWRLICEACGQRFAPSATRWRCTCGGVLDLENVVPARLISDDQGQAGLWRYRLAYPRLAEQSIVSLGEGMTPLIPARHRAAIAYKLDYLFPTGSFKDRGTTVLVSCLRELGITRAVEDSSGNAGASMAAYFAAAGITGTIFVPATASPAKLTQIGSSGARLVPVNGPRSEVARAAQAADGTGYYASHLWSPYFLAGTMSVAFEIWEQLGQRTPDRLVVPVGGGTLLLGAALGFRTLVAMGASDRVPALIGVQAERFAPLYHAFVGGRETLDGLVIPEGETVAEGIRVRRPPRAHQILRAVRECGGWIEVVSETEIRQAWRRLARQGLYVEPTGVVAAAAAERVAGEERGSITVAVLTGSGLKGIAGMPDVPTEREEHDGSAWSTGDAVRLGPGLI